MRKKLFSILVTLALCLGLFPATAFAYVEGDVNTEQAEETEEDADITGSGTEDDEEDSLEVTVSGEGTYTWTYGGSAGTVTENAAAATGTVVNVNSYLNLRTGAGTDYDVIGHLLPGTQVEVIEEENGWYKVTVSEQNGYVSGDYLEVVETAADSLDMDTLLALFGLFFSSSGTDTSEALTPDGNLTLVDDIGSVSENEAGKQFITVVTKSGNYFYIIIDRDDEGESTVHFLNQVDESDLLSLMDEEEAAEYEAALSGTDTDNGDADETDESGAEDNTAAGTAEDGTDENDADDGEASGLGKFLPAILVLVILAVGGGFFAYTKIRARKKEEAKPDPDADYMDDEEDDGEDYDIPDPYEEDGDAGYDGGYEDNEPL